MLSKVLKIIFFPLFLLFLFFSVTTYAQSRPLITDFKVKKSGADPIAFSSSVTINSGETVDFRDLTNNVAATAGCNIS